MFKNFFNEIYGKFNLYFILCPILNSISIFDVKNGGLLMNRCVTAVLVVGAFTAISEFDRMINLVIFNYKDGGMMKSGEDGFGSVEKAVGGAIKTGTAAISVGAKGFTAAAGAAKFAAGAAGWAGGVAKSAVARHNAKKNLGKDAAQAGNKQGHANEALKNIKENNKTNELYKAEVDKQVEAHKETLAKDKNSNYNARKEWDSMTDEQKGKYKNKLDYMNQKYEEYSKEHAGVSKDDWYKEGVETRKEEASGFAKVRSEAEDSIDKRLTESMISGNYDKDDKLAAAATEQYNKAKLRDEKKLQDDKDILEKKGKARENKLKKADLAKRGLKQIFTLTPQPKK